MFKRNHVLEITDEQAVNRMKKESLYNLAEYISPVGREVSKKNPEDEELQQSSTLETLYRIVSPTFVAGLTVENDIVTSAAPILKWTIGQKFSEITFDKTYQVEKVDSSSPEKMNDVIKKICD